MFRNDKITLLAGNLCPPQKQAQAQNWAPPPRPTPQLSILSFPPLFLSLWRCQLHFKRHLYLLVFAWFYFILFFSVRREAFQRQAASRSRCPAPGYPTARAGASSPIGSLGRLFSGPSWLTFATWQVRPPVARWIDRWTRVSGGGLEGGMGRGGKGGAGG